MWAEAGIGPEDMNVVGVYDDYPAMALAQLCDLGFTDAGDLPGFVARRLANRSLPVNTAGGQLSAGRHGRWHARPGGSSASTAAPGGRTPDSGARRGVATGYGMVQLRYGMRQCGGTGKGGRMSLHVLPARPAAKVYPAGCGAACGHAQAEPPVARWRTRGGEGELLASCWPDLIRTARADCACWRRCARCRKGRT